jgi:hypothetical protein
MNMPRKIGLCLYLMTVIVTTTSPAFAGQSLSEHVDTPQCPRASSEATETLAADGPSIEPGRTTRHLGLAGLGLMASVLGVYWKVQHGNHQRRRKRRIYCGYAYPRHAPPTTLDPGVSDNHSTERQRIRRFDYDRFYLHMVRNL